MPGRATNEPTNYFAFAKQTAKDTEGTTFFFLKHLDGTGFEMEQEVAAEREGGDGQEIGLRYKTQLKADGAMVVNARPQVAARLLAYALGADSLASAFTGATGGIHTITPAPTLPYLTVEQFWADTVERTTNVQITGLTIEGEAGRPLKLTANFISGGTMWAKPAASALTATRETSKPLFFPGGSYTINGEGSYANHVTKFRLEVQRQLDDGIYTTGYQREDVVPLNQEYNLDLTFKYEDNNLYERIKFGAVGGTQVQVPFLTTGSFNAYTFFGSYNIRLNMPVIEYGDVKVNKLDPDGKTMYMDVVANSIKSATVPLFAVVTNDEQEDLV